MEILVNMFENLFSTTTATTTKPKTKIFEGIFDVVEKPILLSPKDERKEKVKSLQNEMLTSGQATTAPLLSLPKIEKKTPFVSGLEEGFVGGLKAIGKIFTDIPKRYVKEAVMPLISPAFEKTGELIEKVKKGYQPSGEKLFEELDTKEKAKAFSKEYSKELIQQPQIFTGGMLSSIAGGLGYLERFGWDSVKPISDKLEDWAKQTAPENPNLAAAIVSGAGSMASFYIPGAGIAKGTSLLAGISPKIANLFGNSAMTFIESAMEAGNVYRDNIKQGNSVEEAKRNSDVDFGINVALLALTNKFDFTKTIQKSLVKEIKNRLLTGAREAIQEYGQQIAGNLTTYKKWDEGIAEAGMVGGLLGFMFGGSANPNININVQTQQEIIDLLKQAKQSEAGFAKTPEFVGRMAGKEAKPITKAIPDELAPLAKEARKYKSAEEFVKNYDGGLILNKTKVNNWIAGGPNNTVPVSELLGIEGKKFMKEMDLPDLPVSIQEAGEETIGHYAQIEWRGGNRLKDARINIEISPTEEFGVENLAGKEKDLLHELAHAKQIVLNRLGKKKIQSEISEQAAEKHANYILNKAKSQLTDIYNQATQAVKEVKPAEKIIKKTEKDFRNFTDVDNYLKKHGEELSDTELMEYSKIADELYKAEEEEAYRQTFGDIKDIPEFYGEAASQYQNFKGIVKDLYGSIKKFAETAEDVASIEKIARKKGLINKLTNSLYTQEKTGDEIMNEFKNAIMKEYGYGKTKATVAEKLYTPVKSLKSQKGAFDRRVKQFLLKKAPQLETDFLYSLKKEYRRILDAKALLKYGEEGKQIYDKIKSAENWSVKNEADAIVRLDEPFKKLTKENFAKFGDYVEGKISIPENAIEAVNEWKKIANEIGYRAKNYKVMIKKLDGNEKPFIPIKNYYPYFVKEEELAKIFADQTKYRNFLEDMAMENDMTVAEAHRIIQKMVNGRADFYGHLERSREARLPKEFYERDPRNILAQYIHGAYQRLGIVREFGAEDKGLQKIIQTALEKGEDFEEIQLLATRALGRENFNKDLTKISAFARTYQNITKLSLVAITNISDISKSFIRTNFFSAVKGLIKSFTKEGKIFSRKAGVLDMQLYDYAKEHHLGTMFFKYTGFKWTETEVRRVMAMSSRNYVNLLYKKLVKNPNNAFVKRRLEQFNLDPDELLKKGLKENDLITAAIKAIADSQPVSKLDMPYRWQSPTGKMLTQYKQFAYKQWQFTKEFIFKEAGKGNFKPLLLFLLIGTGLGELVGDLKAWVRGGRKRPEDLPHRIIDNLMTIGGLGLATDFLTNLQYGSYGGGFTKFIVGPTISDIDAWATAIQGDINTIMTDNKFVALRSPNKGERQVKTAKKLLYSLPFFGPALANKLFPTRSEYKARTIPIAEEILQLMEEEQQGVIKPNILKPNILKPNILKPNK